MRSAFCRGFGGTSESRKYVCVRRLAEKSHRANRLYTARESLDCAGAKIFLVFVDHAVLCAVKLDKQTFKDKTFINRWSASQIKHITAKSNSRLRQKILFDIDYQSFAVGEGLFVSRCRRSRWRFVCNKYLGSTLSIHF